MIEQGRLSTTDLVFGTGALLGTTYGTSPYSARLRAVTLGHLLEHTAGGWGNDDDPMFQQMSVDRDALITWTIGDTGFAMNLSGEVPGRLAKALGEPALTEQVLDGEGAQAIHAWAVHPGGKSILDAVERAFQLPGEALAESREVLRACGNMSSATILFVLEKIMPRQPATGIAMAFGPGLAMEGFRFGWTDAD